VNRTKLRRTFICFLLVVGSLSASSSVARAVTIVRDDEHCAQTPFDREMCHQN
jgi:hypothetical protein